MQKIFTSADRRLPSASRGLPNNERAARFRNFAAAILAQGTTRLLVDSRYELPRRPSSRLDGSSNRFFLRFRVSVGHCECQAYVILIRLARHQFFENAAF